MITPPSSSKPRPVSGIDIRQLPIGPEEAFVFSRVDGQTTAREIGHATNFTEDKVARCLSRLESLGAIDFEERPRSQATAPAAVRSPMRPPSAESPQADNAWASRAEPAPAPLYDVAELNAPSNLEAGTKQEILELYYRLDSLDHYQLLGVSRSADRRAVKTAYYEKVKTFHPDRYFGKDLGPFGSKMEHCFARLTAAYDTLGSAANREEYDIYLEAQEQAEELERTLSQSVTLEDLDFLEQQLRSAAKVPASMSLLESTQRQSGPVAASETNVEVVDALPSSPVPKMSDEDRKRFLAHKLRVAGPSLRAPPRISSSAPSPSSPPSREHIAEQLRRQLGAAKREAQLRRLNDHLAAADAAMAADDPVSASNSLRIAQSLAPTDLGIAERLARAQARAALTLSDTYLRQAEYEEKSGRFDAAAYSYERAARGKPSAVLWESAARCLLEAGSDLRSAGEFARMSIAMDPERAASHLLLAQVFLAARMRSSAIAEIERARRLDPNNDTVANLLRRIANDEA